MVGRRLIGGGGRGVIGTGAGVILTEGCGCCDNSCGPGDGTGELSTFDATSSGLAVPTVLETVGELDLQWGPGGASGGVVTNQVLPLLVPNEPNPQIIRAKLSDVFLAFEAFPALGVTVSYSGAARVRIQIPAISSIPSIEIRMTRSFSNAFGANSGAQISLGTGSLATSAYNDGDWELVLNRTTGTATANFDGLPVMSAPLPAAFMQFDTGCNGWLIDCSLIQSDNSSVLALMWDTQIRTRHGVLSFSA